MIFSNTTQQLFLLLVIPGDKASRSESDKFIDFEILKIDLFCKPAKNMVSLIL
jgi:hypothetical protein